MASVALGLARTLGVDPDPFLMAVAVAASSTFFDSDWTSIQSYRYGSRGVSFLAITGESGFCWTELFLTISWFAIPHFWPLNPV